MKHLVASIYFLASVISAGNGELFTPTACAILCIFSLFYVPPHISNVTINTPPGIRSEVKK